jgi:lipopolysaccharide export system permease protein
LTAAQRLSSWGFAPTSTRLRLAPASTARAPCQTRPVALALRSERPSGEFHRSATGIRWSMLRIERYIFRTAAYAFLAGLTALTGIVWVTQALRQVDLLTNKGQSLVVFLTITGLTTPSLVAIIAPVALFVGVLYCLNKLNGDSELVVMSAAGISPARLLRPFLILFTMVFVLVAALYVEVMPWSFGAIDTLSAFIRADFIANFARPGAFNELTSGFIFHFRDRGQDGSLHGVFMQDRRDPAHITTYISEVGKTVARDGETYLVLSKGTYQRPEASGDSAIVSFDDYAIDLSQFIGRGQNAKRPRELSTTELLTYQTNDAQAQRTAGRLRSELTDRLASPFYAFAAGLIGVAALGEARTTRQGRGVAIAAAVLIFAALRMLGVAVISLAVGSSRVAILAWALPIGASALCLDAIYVGPVKRALAGARRRITARLT